MNNREEIYDEVIRQSQENVKALSEKLKAFDELHADIIKLKDNNNKLPQFFDDKFKEISQLAIDYTQKLGSLSNEYLELNNHLFTSKINELSLKIKEIENEISRLEKTDFVELFKVLQDEFIKTARTDLNSELNKFDKKVIDLQNNIDNFKTLLDDLNEEITRLENIDLEKHFDNLQKTLSDIFGAINSLNISFTTIIQTLNKIVQSNSDIENKIDKNAKDTKSDLEALTKTFESQLQQQKDELIKNRELLESRIRSVEIQNEQINKGIKINRIIGIVGISIIITLLIIKFVIK